MVASWAETKKVPRVHGYVEFLDLFPSPTCRGGGSEARYVTKVVEAGRMNLAKRELLKLVEWCSLDGYAQAYERIINSISTVPLSWILTRAGDCKMPKVRHPRKGFDECRHIGGSMKYRRVLLCEEIAQLWRSIFRALGDGCTRCMRRV